MKNLYVCEKCGKVFDNWDDAWACERIHQDADTVYGWNLSQNVSYPTQAWKNGQVAPEFVVMSVLDVDQDGGCVYTTLPDGTNWAKRTAYVYQLAKQQVMPDGTKAADYTEAIYQRAVENNQKKEEN